MRYFFHLCHQCEFLCEFIGILSSEVVHIINTCVWIFPVIDKPTVKLTNTWVTHQYISFMHCYQIWSKVGQIGPKWDKSGAFSDQISVHLAHRAKCTEIWSEKAPDLSDRAKCTEMWPEKAPDLSHLGSIWPTSKPTLPSL